MMRDLAKAGCVDRAVSFWKDDFEFPKADEKNLAWLEEFLAGSPNLQDAQEKGTVSFSIDKHGNIRAHFTPDYYLDLIEMQRGRDLRDPWDNGPSVFIEDITSGYNFAEGRDHPDNRRWATQQCKAHEENLRACPALSGTTRAATAVFAV